MDLVTEFLIFSDILPVPGVLRIGFLRVQFFPILRTSTSSANEGLYPEPEREGIPIPELFSDPALVFILRHQADAAGALHS